MKQRVAIVVVVAMAMLAVPLTWSVVAAKSTAPTKSTADYVTVAAKSALVKCGDTATLAKDIEAANKAPGSVIELNPEKLAVCDYHLTKRFGHELNRALLPPVFADMTIMGNGARLISATDRVPTVFNIAGNHNFRLLLDSVTVTVNFKPTKLLPRRAAIVVSRYGTLVLQGNTKVTGNRRGVDVSSAMEMRGNSSVSGNRVGILISGGELRMYDNSVVSQNVTEGRDGTSQPGGRYGGAGAGAGITLNTSPLKTSTIVMHGHSAVRNNTNTQTVKGGGGMAESDGRGTDSVTITDQASVTGNMPTNCVLPAAVPGCSG